jgi:hypothetical protein
VHFTHFLLLLSNQDHVVPDVTMDSRCKNTPIFLRNFGLWLWSILVNKNSSTAVLTGTWGVRRQEMTRSHVLPLLGQIY